MNIEWREGEQVEVLVDQRKAEVDADDESNGETNLKQSADGHFLEKEENAFEFAVEVEDEHEGGGEEAEEQQSEVEDKERREGREVEDEGRQARASSVSALSVSGEKILAHRSGITSHTCGS